MQSTMWIRTHDGRLINVGWVRRIYAEYNDETESFSVLAEMSDVSYELLRECSTVNAAEDNINFIYKNLAMGARICDLFSDVR